MSFTTTTIQTHTATLPSGEEVEVPFAGVDYFDLVVNAAGTRFGYLVNDEHCFDYEWPEGVELVEGRGAHDKLQAATDDPDTHVFLVGKYEHGLVSYSVHGERWYPDMQWDYGVCGFIVMPNDYTDPLEAATSILTEYTAWCNGDVYGIVIMERAESGDWEETDETCWGFIGSDWAEQALKDEVGA